MPIFDPDEPVTQKEMARQQKNLNSKVHKQAASGMVEFISPGTEPNTNPPTKQNPHGIYSQESFEGGDLWGKDDITRAEAKAFARECIQRGRDKFRSFRTKAVNRILRRVPFGESIKSALRRWA